MDILHPLLVQSENRKLLIKRFCSKLLHMHGIKSLNIGVALPTANFNAIRKWRVQQVLGCLRTTDGFYEKLFSGINAL